jgi:restriction system protein
MNALDAAYKVLIQANKPLHYMEITRQIIDRGLWDTDSKIPEKTLNASFSMDIKKHGESSRFQSEGKGFYSLKDFENLQTNDFDASNTSSFSKDTVSFTDGAEQVLERFGNQKPMHYRTITEKALEQGLISTSGRTPESTMYAQILTEIQRKTRRGERPRFIKHGKGFVGLTKWMGEGLAFQIEQHNKKVHKKLLEKIRKMDSTDFEALIGRLLIVMGFESVSVTPYSGDGGIDVRGTLVVGGVIKTKMAVQVKRWIHNVQAPVVQQVRGSLGAHEQGLIITTSDFSKGAKTEAERLDTTPVALMSGEDLVNLLIENDIGIRRASHDLIELGEEDEE